MGFYVVCCYDRVRGEGDIDDDVLISDKIGCREKTQNPHTRHRTLSTACATCFYSLVQVVTDVIKAHRAGTKVPIPVDASTDPATAH